MNSEKLLPAWLHTWGKEPKVIVKGQGVHVVSNNIKSLVSAIFIQPISKTLFYYQKTYNDAYIAFGTPLHN